MLGSFLGFKGQGFKWHEDERSEKLQCGIGEVEGMLKALIKSLENNHLNP